MIVRIFDIQNQKVIPSEHCYTLRTLKKIMDERPDNFLKIYQYIFYMTCMDPDLNPFFNLPAEEKEEVITAEIGVDFSLDDALIEEGIEFCKKLYDTPTARAYRGISTMLDKLARYMEDTEITDGRDGNITAKINAAKNYREVRASYKEVYNDLIEENKSRLRGNTERAYDQG